MSGFQVTYTHKLVRSSFHSTPHPTRFAFPKPKICVLFKLSLAYTCWSIQLQLNLHLMTLPVSGHLLFILFHKFVAVLKLHPCITNMTIKANVVLTFWAVCDWLCASRAFCCVIFSCCRLSSNCSCTIGTMPDISVTLPCATSTAISSASKSARSWNEQIKTH